MITGSLLLCDIEHCHLLTWQESYGIVVFFVNGILVKGNLETTAINSKSNYCSSNGNGATLEIVFSFQWVVLITHKYVITIQWRQMGIRVSKIIEKSTVWSTVQSGWGKERSTTAPLCLNGPLTSSEKLRVAHTSGMHGTFSPPLRVGDTDMHHGTCVTHVLWCSQDRQPAVSLEVGGGENVPGIPGAYATSYFTYLIRGILR